MVKIAPSILSADFSQLGQEVKQAEAAGADMIHVDVMDGSFVPNITVGPLIVKALKKATSLPIDVHLMIENPDRYIEQFAKAGAHTITVHVEASRHLHRTVTRIKELGVKAGASLNPATPLSALDWILDELDMALIMSVNPGFGGQRFIESALLKIKTLKQHIVKMNLSVEIEVDGGVKVDNAKPIVEAGADILVMGSAFFEADNYNAVIEGVKKQLYGKT
jgi:ribulose-phosphate 3-epimerase